MAVIVAQDVRKTYAGAGAPVEAVRGIDLTIGDGEFVAVMGPSGCGKSTLLHLCGAMDQATGGRLEVLGHALAELDDERLTRLRRDRIGFVFQFFNLLPTLTVVENIALPGLLSGQTRSVALEAARNHAAVVGLDHRLDSYPQQLSGGEMQRTAIARAVAHVPGLIIADEPTGNLDSENGERVLDLLEQLNRDRRLPIVLATHDTSVASRAMRIIHMRDGRVARDEPGSSPAGVMSRASV